MDNLPAWALWIITAAVGFSPGLAFLLVRPIARLLHRVLWPRTQRLDRSVRRRMGNRPAFQPRRYEKHSRVGAQLSIIALALLLSPALAFLMAIAVEIVIGALVEAGVPALLALAVAGAVGWPLFRRLRRRREGIPAET
jgi:hypothetical protein